MSDSACTLCHEEDPAGGGDLRTIRMGCGYDMSEVSDLLVPLPATFHEVSRQQTLWTIRVCKSCRAGFLQAVRYWIDNALAHKVEDEVDELDPERNIPVRVDGASKMMTIGEYLAWRASRDQA